ncbi:MAG: CBS domain-containing protein, partial [Rhodothermales bacterium]
LMDWQRIRHVLVEDHEHRLVGLITHRNLLRFLADRSGSETLEGGLAVKEIMIRDPITVSPETSTMDAIRKMRSYKIGSLPVVREGRLIGIITEKDFIHIAGQMLDDSLGEEGDPVDEVIAGPGSRGTEDA